MFLLDSCHKPLIKVDSMFQFALFNPTKPQTSLFLILRRWSSMAWWSGGWRGEFKLLRRQIKIKVVKDFRKRKKVLSVGVGGYVTNSGACIVELGAGGASLRIVGRVCLESHKAGCSSLGHNGISPPNCLSGAVMAMNRFAPLQLGLTLLTCVIRPLMKSLFLIYDLVYLLCLIQNNTFYWCLNKTVKEVYASSPFTSRKGSEQIVVKVASMATPTDLLSTARATAIRVTIYSLALVLVGWLALDYCFKVLFEKLISTLRMGDPPLATLPSALSRCADSLNTPYIPHDVNLGSYASDLPKVFCYLAADDDAFGDETEITESPNLWKSYLTSFVAPCALPSGMRKFEQQEVGLLSKSESSNRIGNFGESEWASSKLKGMNSKLSWGDRFLFTFKLLMYTL